MATFTSYDGSSTPLALVQAMLAPNSGIAPDEFSILIQSAIDLVTFRPSISFYDGSIAGLGASAGVILTSGDGAPPLTNTSDSYTGMLDPDQDDAALLTSITTAFPPPDGPTEVHDVSSIYFSFSHTNPEFNALEFELMFASDEYPEFSDTSFADIAAVYINGANRALFEGSELLPLSVLDQSSQHSGMRDNQTGVIGIEYDGLSAKLLLRVPIDLGTNTVKIAVGDTDDMLYDSALFVSNIRLIAYDGSSAMKTEAEWGGGGGGDVFGPGVTHGTTGDDIMTLTPNRDRAAGLQGNDVIDGLAELDHIYFQGPRSNFTVERSNLSPSVPDALVFATVTDSVGTEGTDTLYNVERLKFADLNVGLDIQGLGGQAYRLYQAAFDRVPDLAGLGYWIFQFDAGANPLHIASGFIQSAEFQALFGANTTNQEYTLALYTNVLHRAPDQAGYDYWNSVLNGDPLLGQTTREQMLIDFSESAENKANVIGVIGNGFDYVEWV